MNTICFNIGLGLFCLAFSFPHMIGRLLQGRLPKFGKAIVGIRSRTGWVDMTMGREGKWVKGGTHLSGAMEACIRLDRV